MKKNFLAIYLLVLLLGFGGLSAQTALLGDYDFSKGGYSILVAPPSNALFPDRDTSNLYFYFDEVAQLNAFKEELVYDHEAAIYPFSCSSSLTLYVCKDRKALEAIGTSGNCHAITSSKGSFAFQGFLPFKGYKIARLEIFRFPDLVVARKAMDSLLAVEDVLWVTEPDWKVFDGRFTFFREDLKLSREEALADTREKIARRFPKEEFALEVNSSGGSSVDGFDYWIEVRCRRSLRERFDLFDVGKGNWTPFAAELRVFWR